MLTSSLLQHSPDIFIPVFFKKKQCNWWGVRRVAARTIGGLRTGFWSYRMVWIFEKRKLVRSQAAPQGMCDNLIDSLKLLTTQQKDGDSLVEDIVTGLWEKSRKGIMDGLRKFIEVDNHEAVPSSTARR